MRSSTKIAALVSGLALLVSGCASTSPTAAPQDESAPLELWIRTTPGGPTDKGIRKVVEQFQGEGKYKVKVTAIFDDFETKLAQAAAQKDLPDLVMNDVSQLGALQGQGVLREISTADIPNAKDLLPQAADSMKAVDGKTYGVPYSAQATALLVRTDWLSTLGLQAPTTWEEMRTTAQKFTAGDPDGNGQADTFGLSVPGSTKRGYASWYFSNFLWSGGGDFITGNGDGKFAASMSGAESVEAMTWFRNLQCTDKVVQPGAVSMDTPPANEAFESGVAGMYVVGPYLLTRFDKSLGKDKYTAVPLPKGPSDTSVLAEGGSVFVMAGSDNQAGQNAFANFMIGAEGQELGMAEDNGAYIQLPVNKSVDVLSVRNDPRWKTYSDAYADSGRYTPAIPNWTPVRQQSAETVNALLADCSLDVKAEFAKLDEKLNTELASQGVLEKK